MQEIWKDIINYENYEVSNSGKVRNKHTLKELKPVKTPVGYYVVCLYGSGKHKNELIHRLVANAFLKPSNEKKEVNHKNGNKQNNEVSNLEWVTREENMLHALNTLKRKCINKNKQTRCIETEKVYISANIAAKETGLVATAICRCCRGKQKTHGGYHWEYVEES